MSAKKSKRKGKKRKAKKFYDVPMTYGDLLGRDSKGRFKKVR